MIISNGCIENICPQAKLLNNFDTIFNHSIDDFNLNEAFDLSDDDLSFSFINYNDSVVELNIINDSQV